MSKNMNSANPNSKITIGAVLCMTCAAVISVTVLLLNKNDRQSVDSAPSNVSSEISSSSSTAGSESPGLKTTNIFNIADSGNMTVTLYYDVEEPTISFISPDGTLISANELTTERGDTAVCYYIPDAMAGQWQMNYDKKSNDKLEVNWAPY